VISDGQRGKYNVMFIAEAHCVCCAVGDRNRSARYDGCINIKVVSHVIILVYKGETQV